MFVAVVLVEFAAYVSSGMRPIVQSARPAVIAFLDEDEIPLVFPNPAFRKISKSAAILF